MSATTAPDTRIDPTTVDWELDFYSRPVLDADGRKCWELLICSTPACDGRTPFHHARRCPAGSVNSVWLQVALSEAIRDAVDRGLPRPRRLRCWRASMRTMVQRSAESLGLDLVPSRRCYALIDWLRQREEEVYPREEGYMAGPLAPAPEPVRPPPRPLPEAARGQRWQWSALPVSALREASGWEVDFSALVPVPDALDGDVSVPGIQIIGAERSLAIAGWFAGLEPVRLEMEGHQLILEAGLEDRWLLGAVGEAESQASSQAFRMARERADGLQFIAVQARPEDTRLAGFWMLIDRPAA
jgi:hypothetical protein